MFEQKGLFYVFGIKYKKTSLGKHHYKGYCKTSNENYNSSLNKSKCTSEKGIDTLNKWELKYLIYGPNENTEYKHQNDEYYRCGYEAHKGRYNRLGNILS